MLRIYFTADDIARTCLAPGPDPLWDLVLAMHMLRGQRGDLLFTHWRRTTTAELRRKGLAGQLRLLSTLTPTMGYFPDFLTPAAARDGLEHGLEAIRSTPVAVLDRDLRRLTIPAPAMPAVTALAQGDVATLTELTATMDAFYQAAIAPHRRLVQAAVQRDQAIRMAAMADGGIEGLLASLHPMLGWSAGELRVPAHPDQELTLDGRGLLLVGSYFAIRHPMTLLDPALPPVLVYPVEQTPQTLPRRSRLTALLGQTRAAVLHAAGTGCTTTELAGRVGVSPASASEHATVLREAGLLSSRRDGNRMVHHLTRLGLALLNGS
jgi:DNA-binding transcriptional ArsR family regulator